MRGGRPDEEGGGEADATRTGRTPWGRRLLWFAGLWLAGVALVAGLAFLIRLVLVP